MNYLLVALLFSLRFHRNKGIDPNECTPQQMNEEECVVLQPFYTGYQKVVCLSDIQIKARSSGKVKCKTKIVDSGKSRRSYCWYPQCQLNMYNFGFNPDIHSDCKCEWQSRNYCKHDLDRGKERCLKLTNYDSSQKVTCLSSREVLNKAYDSGCPFPETHCWFPCQADKYLQPSGKVKSDCACSSSIIATPTNISLLLFISLILYLLL